MAMEKFHFTSADGEVEITVPFFLDGMTRKNQKKLTKLSKEAGGIENVEEDEIMKLSGLDKAIIDKLDGLSVRDFNKFLQGWQEESQLGES